MSAYHRLSDQLNSQPHPAVWLYFCADQATGRTSMLGLSWRIDGTQPIPTGRPARTAAPERLTDDVVQALGQNTGCGGG